MRKLLTWTIVSMVAILAMGYVAFQIISDSTASLEKVVITEMRSRALAKSRRTPAEESLDGGPAHSAESTLPSEDCETENKRWLALLDQAVATVRGNFRVGGRFWERRLYPDLYPDDDLLLEDTPPDFWSQMAANVRSNAAVLDEFETLARRLNYDCGCLQQQSTPGPWRLDCLNRMLETDLAFSLYRQDFDSAMNNLRSTTALASAAQRNDFPYWIEPQHLTAVVNALAAGTVKDETWQSLLSTMRVFRDRNFMDPYVQNFPHIPFGASVQETSYLKRGVKAAIHEFQKPMLNHDTVRLAPLVEELAVLAEVPYYEAKPELDGLVAEYGLTPHDRHSYSNESGARASIVNLIHAVFPRNAVVQAQIDVFSLVIALELTRRDWGAYPRTLDAATECFGYPVSLNPIDGTPYHYQTSGGNYRLGFELDRPILITMLERESAALWVESVDGAIKISGGEE